MYTTLWFTHDAHREMLQLASQTALDGLETGGHLYGYTHRETGTVAITKVLPIGPNARRTRRSLDWDNEAVKEYDKRYRGNAQWEVGDFHTHPVPEAIPSPMDDSGTIWWRNEMGWDPAYPKVMIILGVPQGGKIGEVGAWFWASPTERITLGIDVGAPGVNPVDENGNWIEITAAGA